MYKAEDKTIQEKYGVAVGYDKDIPRSMYVYSEALWERNRRLGVKNQERLSVGIGQNLSWPFLLIKPSLGLRGAWETRTNGPFKRDAEWFVKLKVATSYGPATLWFSVMRDEAFGNSSDWRLLYKGKIECAVNKHWGIYLSRQFERRHEPVPGFTDTDATTGAGVSWRL